MKIFIINKNTFLLFIIIFLFFIQISATAQISNVISAVRIETAKENEDLPVFVNLLQSTGISNISIFYRSFGNNEFTQQELMLTGATASTTIPGKNISPPFLEYYLKIEYTNGNVEYYPIDYPAAPPIQVQVQTTSPRDKEVIILSPEKNTKLRLEEFFVSISLLRASDQVNKPATKIYIDNADISDLVLFADDIILFYAQNFPGSIKAGVHILKVVLYDMSGNVYNTVTSGFEIIPSENEYFPQSNVKYYLNLRGESRNEDISKTNTLYNNLLLNTGSEYKDWNFDGSAYITSEEKSYLQPNDRYLIAAKNDWLRLSYGDDFPQLPSLILNGKRVRGLNADLNTGIFQLQISWGEINRGIEGKVLNIYPNDSLKMGPNIIPIGNNQFAEVNLGTYKRNLLAIHPSINFGDVFQFGLSVLHSKDDMSSIVYGTRPEENLVFGSDFSTALDNQKIILTGQAAFCLINTDISAGSFTDQQINNITHPDSIFDGEKDDLTNLKKYFGNFITINQFLTPINGNNLSTFAAETALQLNYFDNYFKFSCIYRGNDFESFGQSNTRTDVGGINFADRLRLIENSLFISGGYENLSDNLQETKLSTTTFQTISSSVSYYPRINAPNFIIGYTWNKDKNTIILPDNLIGQFNYLNSIVNDSTNRYTEDEKLMYNKLLYAVNDITNRFSFQVGYDLMWKVKHQVSLNFSLSNRQDNSALNYNLKNYSINFSSNSYWSKDFNSNLILSLNNTKINSIDPANRSNLNYFSVILGGRYTLLEGKLFIFASINPTFGDLARRMLEFNAQYYFVKNFSVSFQGRLINWKNYTDTIVGLTSTYEL